MYTKKEKTKKNKKKKSQKKKKKNETRAALTVRYPYSIPPLEVLCGRTAISGLMIARSLYGWMFLPLFFFFFSLILCEIVYELDTRRKERSVPSADIPKRDPRPLRDCNLASWLCAKRRVGVLAIWPFIFCSFSFFLSLSLVYIFTSLSLLLQRSTKDRWDPRINYTRTEGASSLLCVYIYVCVFIADDERSTMHLFSSFLQFFRSI